MKPINMVDDLNDMAERVRNGDLVIENIKYSNDTDCVHDFNMTLIGYVLPKKTYKTKIGYMLPKKTYKTQSDIYEELYDEYAILLSKNCYYKGDANDTSIRCNRYAVENTQRVWREQYEVH